MKFKPLALMILLALPLLIIPSGLSATPVNPKIWVNPSSKKFWAPCQVSNEFTVDIKLWNKKEITGASIYAYDLWVYWDPTLISFVKADVFPPWPEGSYFIIKNVYNETGDNNYHLAITALDTTPPLDDVQIILVTLTFHIEKEPCWPTYFDTAIDVQNVKLSGPCGVPITITDDDITDGHYYIYSSQPALWLDPAEFTYNCICKDQVVSVMAANLTGMYGFEFTVTWDNSKLLEANIQCVHVTDLLAPPYEAYLVTVGNNYVHVEVMKPCTKPTVSCVEGPLVTICFHTKYDDLGAVLPTAVNVTLTITNAHIYSKCPQPKWTQMVDITPLVEGAVYHWKPKKEDLDLSCHVDIADLTAIAKKYGKPSVWADLAAPTGGNVDLYDIVVVAKKFCKTDP
jgi:hypothetical protein